MEFCCLNECVANRRRLVAVLSKVDDLVASDKLIKIRNERNKNIGHFLSQSRLEQKSGPMPPIKHGDEAWLLDQSIEAIHWLSIAISGANYSWDEARKNARRTSEEFWNGCNIQVIE
jgi:hypothetical protein